MTSLYRVRLTTLYKIHAVEERKQFASTSAQQAHVRFLLLLRLKGTLRPAARKGRANL